MCVFGQTIKPWCMPYDRSELCNNSGRGTLATNSPGIQAQVPWRQTILEFRLRYPGDKQSCVAPKSHASPCLALPRRTSPCLALQWGWARLGLTGLGWAWLGSAGLSWIAWQTISFSVPQCNVAPMHNFRILMASSGNYVFTVCMEQQIKKQHAMSSTVFLF